MVSYLSRYELIISMQGYKSLCFGCLEPRKAIFTSRDVLAHSIFLGLIMRTGYLALRSAFDIFSVVTWNKSVHLSIKTLLPFSHIPKRVYLTQHQNLALCLYAIQCYEILHRTSFCYFSLQIAQRYGTFESSCLSIDSY